ncbi:MAG: Crp/Fnr family transcriptional regulator [Parvibaculaceae bacterium]|nr:Crp/Fnr family transcriptional regulator [Parvibaculaceae bacterium]
MTSSVNPVAANQPSGPAGGACCECQMLELGLCGTLMEHPENLIPPPSIKQMSINKKVTLNGPGTKVTALQVIKSGWAIEYLMSRDGRRQIISFLFDGDMISASNAFAFSSHCTVQSITDMEICSFGNAWLKTQIENHSYVQERISTFCFEEKELIQRKLFELGRCSADERIALLILNLRNRQIEKQMTDGEEMDFPLKQQHLADAMGLTQVHISRVMRKFTDAGYIENNGKKLVIRDLSGLENHTPSL